MSCLGSDIYNFIFSLLIESSIFFLMMLKMMEIFLDVEALPLANIRDYPQTLGG